MLRRLKSDAGFTTVEFALLISVVSFIVFLGPDLVLMGAQKFTLGDVANAAVRQMAIQGGMTSTIREAINDSLKRGGIDPSKVIVESSTPYPVQAGNPVNVTLRYTYRIHTLALVGLNIASVPLDTTAIGYSERFFR